MAVHYIRLVIFGILLYFIESKNAIEVPIKQEKFVESLVKSSNATEDTLFKTRDINEFQPNADQQKTELNESSSGNSEIESCIGLIEEGKKRIRSDREEVVLVLGITGSGKTTLIQFLAGENNTLFAEEDDGATGDYTIVDSENKISSNSTIVSKTIFPELVVDRESGVAYYDCQGFGDTRGTTTDVAGTFFIREIIKNVKRVKILLIVNYSSVRKGGDRQDFLQLVRHTLGFLKNVDKYANSIALVVSKVENSYKKVGNKLVLVPDKAVTDYIAQFLVTFEQQVQQVANDDDRDFAARAKQLIEILLRTNGTDYERIGVFRRPDAAGPLGENELLRSGEGYIKKMVAERIVYADVEEADFGYTVSDRSINQLLVSKRETYDNIAGDMNEIRTQIRKFCQSKEEHSVDIDRVAADVRSLRDKIENCLRGIPPQINIEEFVGNLRRLLVNEYRVQPNVTEVHLAHMLKQQKLLEFLQMVDRKRFTLVDLSAILKEKLTRISWDLDDSLKWYRFLNNLYDRLTSYEIQKDKTRFGYLYQQPPSDLNDANFKEFIDVHVTDINFQEIEGMRVDATKLSLLNQMLQSTLKPNVVSATDPHSGTYEIRGDFVMLSHIDRKLLEKSKFLNIFASRKIFINNDLMNTERGLHQISIVAPTWEVVGHKKIVLNGKDGYLTSGYRAAADGIYPGHSGSDGLPGMPGNPGGNFLGVGGRFINGFDLEIFANGGDGSTGQPGGAGAPGVDGASPNSGKDSWRFRTSYQGGSFLWIKRHYCVYGENGGNGGRGGNGGTGGKGGPAGNVNLITLADRLSATQIHSDKGMNGLPGWGGLGGRGGYGGRSIEAEKSLWWWSSSDRFSYCSNSDSDRNGRSGRNGISGGNTEGAQNPKILQRLSQETVLNNYKTFFQKSITDEKLKREKLNEFFNQLPK